jgi:hypothetical protein
LIAAQLRGILWIFEGATTTTRVEANIQVRIRHFAVAVAEVVKSIRFRILLVVRRRAIDF